MNKTHWAKAVSCAALFATPMVLSAQKAPKAADLQGTWQLVSSKNLKTGVVTPRDGIDWMQLTKSHFTVVSMDNGRPNVSEAKYDSLSAEEKIKVDYARIFNEKGDQVFAARGGTWRLASDNLHQTAVMAIYAPIIGVDRVLKIVRLDNRSLVLNSPGFGGSDVIYQLTYRRVD